MKFLKGNVRFVQPQSPDKGSVDQEQYAFPLTSTTGNPDYLTLHHPDEVWGLEDEKPVLAVVPQYHTHVV